MNILIFGASGATGYALVRQALNQGHQVTAFVRNPDKLKISPGSIRFWQGDVTDYAAVNQAVQNQDAVLSALGASSPLKRDLNLIEGVRNIVKAMEHANVQRFIYLSFLGVKEGRQRSGFFIRYIIPMLLQNVIQDHEAKEAIIKQSTLNWTIVRPPKLTLGKHTGLWRSGENIKPHGLKLTLSRADVADFMLQQLSDNTFSRKAPLILH